MISKEEMAEKMASRLRDEQLRRKASMLKDYKKSGNIVKAKKTEDSLEKAKHAHTVREYGFHKEKEVKKFKHKFL